jgi:RHS repeat-associated protein
LFAVTAGGIDAQADTCELYPIALSSEQVQGVTIGTVFEDVFQGRQPGNFGWLTWSGSPSVPTLVNSLTPPGDSWTYENPDDSTDHIINRGDWVQGKPGVSNSKKVRNALDALIGTEITVPAWDQARGQGNNADYRVAGFVRIELLDYHLPRDNRITARLTGFVTCGEVNTPPVVDAGPDQTIIITNAASLSADVSDDGLPTLAGLTLLWSKTAGPGNVSFADPQSASTEAVFTEIGTYVLTMTANDGELTAADGIEIVVLPPNKPPQADPQDVQTDEDAAVNITLTATDPNGDPLTFNILDNPDHGTLSGSAPDLLYTPDPNYFGSDAFLFEAHDGETNSNPATISITVNPVNDAPVADSQSLTTDEDTTLDMTLTGSDIEDDPLDFLVTQAPENGVLQGSASDLAYLPDENWYGTDAFLFAVSDGTLTSTPVSVNITVAPVNDRPNAEAQNVDIDEDTSVDITLVGSDVDGDILGYSIVAEPSSGTLSGVLPEVTYTPDADYHGADAFTFSVSDDSLTSTPAQVVLTVHPVNDPPVAQEQALQTDEDVSLAVTLAGTDVDGDALTFLLADLPVHGTLSGTPPGLVYTPEADWHGTDGLTFVVSDGAVTSGPAVVQITVESVNDAPVVDAGEGQLIDFPESTVVNGTASDDDTPVGAELVYQWSMADGPGTALFDDPSSADSAVSFDAAGVYVLRLTVSDTELESTDEVTVYVNAAPEVSVGEDAVITYPDSITLSAVVTDDGLPEDLPPTVSWVKASGPGDVAFSAPAAAETVASFSEIGDYILRLAAGDSRLITADSLNVSVRPAGANKAPAVDAGEDRVSGLSDTVVLSGVVEDDGLPWGETVTSAWEQVSGPGTAVFNDPQAPQSDATFDVSGTYVLRLTASDGELSTADEVSVTVHIDNLPPAVDAGPDQTVTAGTVELEGSASDDGLPAPGELSVSWTLVSGPADVVFSAPDKAVTSVSVSENGVYTLRLTADDEQTAVSDDMILQVDGNRAPVVDAGPDQQEGLFVPAPYVQPPVEIPDIEDQWLYEPSRPGLREKAGGQYYVQVNSKSMTYANDRIYVGGNFKTANGEEVWGIAAWNGCSYEPLFDENLPYYPRLDLPAGHLAHYHYSGVASRGGSNVFAKGYLRDLNEDGQLDPLARWDGAHWNAIPMPPYNRNIIAYMYAKYVNDDGELYIGGSFSLHAVSDPALTSSYSLAKYDGSNWVTLGRGIHNNLDNEYPEGSVDCVIEAPNGDVYAAGDFSMPTDEGIAANIARWDGTQWHPVGNGLTTGGDIKDMVFGPDGRLYVGATGDLRTDTSNMYHVAAWDGTNWAMVGSGINNDVNNLHVWKGRIYATGSYTMRRAIGGRALRGFAWYDADAGVWRRVDVDSEQLYGTGISMAGDDHALYVGGRFTKADNLNARNIVKWGQPYLPELTLPEPVTVFGRIGQETEVVLTAEAYDRCGAPLTVSFNRGGGAPEYTVTVTNTALGVPVAFTNSYPVGEHDVYVSVTDSNWPAVSGWTRVTVVAPAGIALNGTVSDDGLPAGVTNIAWSLIDGPAPVQFACSTCAATQAEFSQPGTYRLQLLGDDTALTATDEMIVTIFAESPGNQPPIVYAGGDEAILEGEELTLYGLAADDGLPGGTLLTQWTVVDGPGEAAFSDTNTLTTTVSFSQVGSYTLRLTADDGEETVSDECFVQIEADPNAPPTVSAGSDASVMLPEAGGTTAVVLNGETADDGLPYGTINESWSQVDGPASVVFKYRDGAYRAVFAVPGTYTLRFTAEDGRLSAYDDMAVTVREYIPEPAVAIESPADTEIVSAPTPVIGTVDTPLLAQYELQFRMQDVEQETEEDWKVLATGSTAVVSGELGTLDPTLALNGTYELRLTAADLAGRSVTSETVTVVFDGNMKVGMFTLSFRDLSVPLEGVPIEVVRTYDSRAAMAGREGDFGPGWTLSLKDIRLQKNRPLGARWYQEITGFTAANLAIHTMDPWRDRIVTITMPDNEVYRFKAVFNPDEQVGVPIVSGEVVFEPLPGTYGSLEVVGGSTVRCVGDTAFYDPFGTLTRWFGYVDLLDMDELTTFEPTAFSFTTQEGMTFMIDETDGLQSVVDRNGNEVIYAEDGIYHSSGASVQFVRDSEGRISRIIDPEGHSLFYTYGAEGDLEYFNDRTTNTTEFTYSAVHTHLLEDVIDPRGVRAVRTEYDEDGRMIRQIDADGNPIAFTHDIENRRETVEDRLGNVTVHEYDDRGNVVKTIDPLGGITTHTYDEWDNELSQTDPLGHTTTWTYDAYGNQTSETDPLGNTTYTDYNTRRQPVRMEDAGGNVTIKYYDGRGNLTNKVDALGNSTSYSYDPRGNLLVVVDALGHVTSNEYGSSGFLVRRTDASGAETRYTRDANGRETSRSVTRTTPSGMEVVTTSNIYDSSGRKIRVIHPDGSVTESRYDSRGKKVATVDELGRETEMVYNDRGELIKTVHPDGSIVGVGYDAEGRRVAQTNEEGFVTRYEYDGEDNLVATIYPNGAVVSNEYDSAGRIAAVTDPSGNVTYHEYGSDSDRELPVRIVDALGHAMTYDYDEVGNAVAVGDKSGHVTEISYDAKNWPGVIEFPDGTTGTTTYDAMGRRLSVTDQAGNETSYGYDELGRLVAVTNAMGGVTRYEYDEMGNQISQTDANGHTTRFEYDSRGRRIKRILPEGQVETYAYDPAGNMTNKVDFNGKTTTFVYDNRDRLIMKIPDPSFGASNIVYTYDDRGLRTSMHDQSGVTTYSYDDQGLLVEKDTPVGTLSYSYDAAGNLIGIHSSNSNGTDIAYQYDELNRLKYVLNPETGMTAYNYDPMGNLQNFIYPNGVSHSYQYDALNRLTNLSIAQMGEPVAGYAYGLNAAGHRTRVQELTGRTVQYAYDELYRLEEESISGALMAGTITYTYDAVGNRLSRDSTVANVLSKVYGYDMNDRLNADGYDENGNTTTADIRDPLSGDEHQASDVYDFENRLVERTTSDGRHISIVYDGDGHRVSKTVDGVTTYYLVDDQNPSGYAQVVEELSDVGGSVSVDCRYTHGSDLISQEQLVDTATGTVWQTSYYGYDGQGSVRFLTDENGQVTDTYDYDAFGNLLYQQAWDPTLMGMVQVNAANQHLATPNDYRYKGEQFDPDLDLYFLRARYMDPERGRFWTVDPFEGMSIDPISLHKYLYANASPINFSDPTGRMTLEEISLTSVLIATMAIASFSGLDYLKPETGAMSWNGGTTLWGGGMFGGVGGIGFSVLDFEFSSESDVDVEGYAVGIVLTAGWTPQAVAGFGGFWMFSTAQVNSVGGDKDVFEGFSFMRFIGAMFGSGLGFSDLRIGQTYGDFTAVGPVKPDPEENTNYVLGWPPSIGVSVFMGWTLDYQ